MTSQDPTTPTQQPDDPAIGMVGGSYGGGIQLVTAGIDPRVDVIVPGIAWNSLTAPSTRTTRSRPRTRHCYCSALVTAGARINPQIYGGIITGDVLGILTPSQQALRRPPAARTS